LIFFGKNPGDQGFSFLISSEIKCAHFHDTEVAKPTPSYQVYKGTVFDLVDQAQIPKLLTLDKFMKLLDFIWQAFS